MGGKIKLFATQIHYTEEELGENEVYVEFDVTELLEQIDDDDISQYARSWCSMMYEDDYEPKLDDFTDNDLVKELKYRCYNFSKQIGEDDCVDFLEDSGYEVVLSGGGNLDVIDEKKLIEISKKFMNGSWVEREEMYKKLM